MKPHHKPRSNTTRTLNPTQNANHKPDDVTIEAFINNTHGRRRPLAHASFSFTQFSQSQRQPLLDQTLRLCQKGFSLQFSKQIWAKTVLSPKAASSQKNHPFLYQSIRAKAHRPIFPLQQYEAHHSEPPQRDHQKSMQEPQSI